MAKTFIIDTNVLIHDPKALDKFEENDIVIPLPVLQELDGLKKAQGEVGRNARETIRRLDALREEGALHKGVELESGGVLTVAFPPENFEAFSVENNDDLILSVAYEYARWVLPEQPVILVTKDANLRVKANVQEISAQDYTNDAVDAESLYPGWAWINASHEQINALYKRGRLALPEVQGTCTEGLLPNQCVFLRNPSDIQQSALGRYDAKSGHIIRLTGDKVGPMGLKPRNREQRFALDMLLDPSIALVSLVGRAGTGKTLLAMAAGLHQVMEDETYRRVLVSRPVVPMGRDIGFLPGTEEEKLNPWMQPIYDNVEVMMQGKPADHDHEKKAGYLHPAEELQQRGYLQVGALTYIRGRSIPTQYILIDECQNTTPHEMKTIISRAGEGTKIVLTGDPEQIDNPYVDAASNGLSYVAERFKNQAIAGHLTLIKGERSELAEIAADIL